MGESFLCSQLFLACPWTSVYGQPDGRDQLIYVNQNLPLLLGMKSVPSNPMAWSGEAMFSHRGFRCLLQKEWVLGSKWSCPLHLTAVFYKYYELKWEISSSCWAKHYSGRTYPTRLILQLNPWINSSRKLSDLKMMRHNSDIILNVFKETNGSEICSFLEEKNR